MFSDLPIFTAGAFFNLAVAVVIVTFIYYPATKDKRYVFSFLAFNTTIYFVLQTLSSVELSIGVGFGLFAIFSVLNYRTDEMPIREMTYLFTVLALPVMNSFLTWSDDVPQILIANGIIVALLFVLERGWGFHYEASKRLTYEIIDLITPDKRELLLADLCKRTGLPVKRVEVGRIDFLRDTAEIRIFYDEPKFTEHEVLPYRESNGRVPASQTEEPTR